MINLYDAINTYRGIPIKPHQEVTTEIAVAIDLITEHTLQSILLGLDVDKDSDKWSEISDAYMKGRHLVTTEQLLGK